MSTKAAPHPGMAPVTGEEPATCSFFEHVPWYDCQVAETFRAYMEPCFIHHGRCTGHAFCPEHLAATVANRDKAGSIQIIRRVA